MSEQEKSLYAILSDFHDTLNRFHILVCQQIRLYELKNKKHLPQVQDLWEILDNISNLTTSILKYNKNQNQN